MNINKTPANIIFNAKAGVFSSIAKEGYIPRLLETHDESDIGPALKDLNGIVVSVGGDGTFRAIASKMIQLKMNNPVVIIPAGTANNIAQAVGMTPNPLQVLDGLKDPIEYMLDAVMLDAPWGKTFMFEGLGFGIFAEIMHEYEPENGKSITRGLEAVVTKLPDYQGRKATVFIDERKLEGEFDLFQVLNTPAVGPRLHFAKNASPRDGLLDVVYIEHAKRENLLSYLSNLFSKEIQKMESVKIERCKKIKFEWDGFPIHVDDKTFSDQKGTIQIEIIPQAIKLWIPK